MQAVNLANLETRKEKKEYGTRRWDGMMSVELPFV